MHSKATADGKSEEGGNYVKSSRGDLCKMGCNTLDSESDRRIQRRKSELNLKNFRSLDYFLKFGSMKLELLVIEDHNASVNRKPHVYSPPITG